MSIQKEIIKCLEQFEQLSQKITTTVTKTKTTLRRLSDHTRKTSSSQIFPDHDKKHQLESLGSEIENAEQQLRQVKTPSSELKVNRLNH